ncbi:MAG: hypothetical protein HQ481_07690 [Alphaproteobacteria bacterium]|nr:hypothetical protein [Alphaproteobacteria bacterium]
MGRILVTRLATVLLLLALANCGFQPLYGARGGDRATAPTAEMAAVSIGQIFDRPGQLLRNALLDRLNPTGEPSRPRWRLDLSLTEARSDTVILRDSTATFAKYSVDARWVLVDLTTQAPITRGRARRTTSFSIVSSEFATLEAERDAQRRAMTEIAEDIRLRLGLFFQRSDG